ncbi:hypothetical protein HSBAA_05360 [Vreelandella sulfidaeris]|uniref:Alpha-D-phosphohexomutase alpha/beta/alpha domain-containing protein n=1 Tax=Vreelandella sulfidaeris TaxID=115553 RepID=A0A455U031_9GAMM|nr:hypothetical protein HSBAA_05360 [Halomonas sulfidaeris]
MLEAPLTTAEAAQLGKATRIDDAAGRYIEFCKSTLPDRLSLHGLKIVLDCAHGATYHIAPNVFRELGADVTTIGSAPDGLNINQQVGSTHPRLYALPLFSKMRIWGSPLMGMATACCW